MKTIVLAAAAHPDDIEFMMAGTLLLLRRAGAEIHLWNLANGALGTATYSRAEIARIRWGEASEAARLIGATLHPPLFDDLAIFYDAASLARVGAVIRAIRPTVILTQSPQDYMEDHQNTCRLVVSGAFTRGMVNFEPEPREPTYDASVALYHALPHGLRDQLRQPIVPHFYANTTDVMEAKRAMLACHRSQKEWLDVSQGMDAYLNEMTEMGREVGRLSGVFDCAEGWRRHSHLGFGPIDHDPLKTLLEKDYAEAAQ